MLAAIERERLSWTMLLPGVITDFLNHPRRGDYDLSTFRFAIGYANMMPGVVRSFCEQVCGFWDAFGQTETSYLVAHGWVPPGGEPSLRKTPGPLMDVRIVDEDLHELEVGAPGECVVRGPSVMSGYLGDADATAEVFAGGWLHTGDVLARNEDGTLSYVDRKKYLIKTGGENVYPAEVEAAIASDPAVQEVCVLGDPRRVLGRDDQGGGRARRGPELQQRGDRRSLPRAAGGLQAPALRRVPAGRGDAAIGDRQAAATRARGAAGDRRAAGRLTPAVDGGGRAHASRAAPGCQLCRTARSCSTGRRTEPARASGRGLEAARGAALHGLRRRRQQRPAA